MWLSAYVNQARIRSCDQPVLSFLLKETTRAFYGAQTHDWQASGDYESDALPTAPRREVESCLSRQVQANTSWKLLVKTGTSEHKLKAAC